MQLSKIMWYKGNYGIEILQNTEKRLPKFILGPQICKQKPTICKCVCVCIYVIKREDAKNIYQMLIVVIFERWNWDICSFCIF